MNLFKEFSSLYTIHFLFTGKHCNDEEFECDKIVYGSNSRQCIRNIYVCDNHPDCDDGSDEFNCPDKNKQGML